MKTTSIIILLAFSLTLFSQEENKLRFGIQLGFHDNKSTFSGGMTEANARFNQKSFGGGTLDLIARYDFNKRWMLMSGLGFSSFGFEFSLSENYSLLHKSKRTSDLRSEFGAFEIPLMAYYKFNPNCKNSKWLIGAGFANQLTGSSNVQQSFNTSEIITNSTYLNSTSQSKAGSYMMLRFAIAREKTFNKGGILNASMFFNMGLSGPMAQTTVNYQIDNVDYSHEYTNFGNYVGFRLAYFFKPTNH